MSRFSLIASCLRLSKESLLKSVAITWKSSGNVFPINGQTKNTFAPSFARNKQLALPIPCPWIFELIMSKDINIKLFKHLLQWQESPCLELYPLFGFGNIKQYFCVSKNLLKIVVMKIFVVISISHIWS